MTADEFPTESLNRILVAVETIEESLGVLARKQQISREDFKADSDTRDIVERRFVKLTEASIDIGEELVKYERGEPPASNPASMRVLGELDILTPPVPKRWHRQPDFATFSRIRTDRSSTTIWSTMRCRIWIAIGYSSSKLATISMHSVFLKTTSVLVESLIGSSPS